MKTSTDNVQQLIDDFYNKSKVKKGAPSWVKDGFKFFVHKQGMSPQEAIETLRRTPFFSEEWVV